ncbi:A/G-specific adenine glycosylase [Paracoccus denitrificans]|uniref:Adenine DNA glycosylase n=2 Tax=Paracoccus denitrificans TaxID=266 RepID=A1B3U5_PARDP|nr:MULTISPECIES: A/G-specific adenine glycosylase [Paracoccus]ABL70189.1 A/G-specific DNA-adenine glycosylase [Paracoccus denitrificans PD1222]MCU7430422.1 A/G-specific adenine glycosylase [Paracoccus denitrificans]UFS66179.1 A/G-specific adenine glycosylase [Paracoccus denitrificans]UPV96475.1 A/G-specific adenine glycosylase [Paracoccus denitrificans]WQO34908.1 A/G-specific adenine glycosylase [Paracoccus denitrificans]
MPPGRGTADPYRVWLSEVMLQQTTVAAVKAYFERFTSLWPTVHDLAAAEDAQVMAEWAGLGYYARARNLIACARAVSAMGAFPDTRAELADLPGIGAYTSAAIAAIAFDRPETVVDGNVERVVARLFAVETPLPAAKPELVALAAGLTPSERPGDFAQAMMDLGATICTPRSPACGICPVIDHCAARAQGIAADLPRKAPKKAKPLRQGIVWIGFSKGAVLVETRPDRGLLGGTLAFPSTGWDGSDLPPPAPGDWQEIGLVRHVFTHFALDLTVMTARLTAAPERGNLAPLSEFRPAALPGLMRKAWALARPETATLPATTGRRGKTG